MEGLKIAVIGGGSSYTPELIEGFIRLKEELPISEIALVDISEGQEKLDIITALSKRMMAHAGMDTKITSTLDRRRAIEGADYVLTQMRVGGLKARALDERLPLERGIIGQETTGAGGFAKAMRTIPVLMDVAKDVEEVSNSAWLINFTNPAGLVTEALQRYTSVKTLGLCNVPITMKHNMARLFDVPAKEVFIEFMGLNHLVWGKRVFIEGQDRTQAALHKMMHDDFSMKNIPDLKWVESLLKGLEAIPCPYHRYYYMQREILEEEWSTYKATGQTRAIDVQRIESELFQLYRDPQLKTKPAQLQMRGGAYYSEAAVSLINAIAGDLKEIHTVNTKNNGALLNFDAEAVVEVNAVIGKGGPAPLAVGKIPTHAKGLMEAVKAYEILTAQAAVTGDEGLAIQALSIHPLVDSYTVAKALFADMKREHKLYFTQFK